MPERRIYYNESIPGLVNSPNPTNNPYLFITASRLHASQKSGRAVIEYQDGVSGPFVGMVVVETRPYREDPLPNQSSMLIGDELQPIGFPARSDFPWVTRGLPRGPYGDGGDPDEFVYQHANAGSFEGRVFSTRETSLGFSQVEVVWTRRDRHNRAVWPYEIRRYASTWPTNPQRYVIARQGEPSGEKVTSPCNPDPANCIVPTLMDYQVQSDGSATKHAALNGQVFSAVKPGLSLLRYELDRDRNDNDWVGFQAIRTLLERQSHRVGNRDELSSGTLAGMDPFAVRDTVCARALRPVLHQFPSGVHSPAGPNLCCEHRQSGSVVV